MRKKYDVGVLEVNVVGKNFVESIIFFINSKIECKFLMFFDRDKEIFNRMMSRLVNGKKKFFVDKVCGMKLSVDFFVVVCRVCCLF